VEVVSTSDAQEGVFCVSAGLHESEPEGGGRGGGGGKAPLMPRRASPKGFIRATQRGEGKYSRKVRDHMMLATACASKSSTIVIACSTHATSHCRGGLWARVAQASSAIARAYSQEDWSHKRL